MTIRSPRRKKKKSATNARVRVTPPSSVLGFSPVLRKYGGEVRDNHGEGQRQTGRATHPVQQATGQKKTRACDPRPQPDHRRTARNSHGKPDKHNASHARTKNQQQPPHKGFRDRTKKNLHTSEKIRNFANHINR